SPAPVLEARELYRFHHTDDDEIFALRGVSLSVVPGEILAVTGPSGSGKSTLLACLAGLDQPDGGHVIVGGTRVSRRDEVARAELRARHIGFLFQTGNLFDHLDLADNLRLVRRLAGRPPGDVTSLLSELGLADRAHARPSTLSGGEAARAGLAVALANDPAVVLADEPTGELDRTSEATVIGLLRTRAEQGIAIVIATHSAQVAAAADREIRLQDGAIA
ncbi:MAG: putative transport system ATP-binding protein, partial [Acidimicrobiaceae bacterium]